MGEIIVNINFTLIGQMITFAIFVWVTMTYVWPMLEVELKNRSKKIAEGLSAAKEGHEILAKSKENASIEVQNAKKQAAEIIVRAKKEAKSECDNMIKTAKVHIQQEKNQARANLQAEIVSIVIKGVEKILSKSINNKDNADIIAKIIRKG